MKMYRNIKLLKYHNSRIRCNFAKDHMIYGTDINFPTDYVHRSINAPSLLSNNFNFQLKVLKPKSIYCYAPVPQFIYTLLNSILKLIVIVLIYFFSLLPLTYLFFIIMQLTLVITIF